MSHWAFCHIFCSLSEEKMKHKWYVPVQTLPNSKQITLVDIPPVEIGWCIFVKCQNVTLGRVSFEVFLSGSLHVDSLCLAYNSSELSFSSLERFRRHIHFLVYILNWRRSSLICPSDAVFCQHYSNVLSKQMWLGITLCLWYQLIQPVQHCDLCGITPAMR